MRFLRFRFIGFSLILLFLTSCGKNSLQCIDKPNTNSQKDPFKNVQVEVGVDGSGSMIGFVSQPGTRYSQAIDSLNTLLQTKGVPTQYWRIGVGQNVDKPQLISSNQFLEARSPTFYDCKIPNSSFPCVSSTLEQIYTLPNQDPKQDSLKILLTDLEPDSAAVAQLSSKISAELKAHQDYKAMLLGVRSEYDGHIYSAMTGKVVIPQYSTNGKNVDQEGRPFYVLLSGPSQAVDEIVSQFQKLPLDVSKAFRAASFAIGGIDAVALDSTKIPAQLNACVSQTGAIKRSRPAGNQKDQWLLLEQTCASKEALSLNLPSEKAVVLAGANLTPKMFNVSNPAVTLKTIKVDNDQMQLNLLLDTNQIPPKDGEAIYLTLQKHDLDQAVWQDWDTSVAVPDGAKTQNLSLFVSGLRTALEGVTTDKKESAATQEAVKYCLGLTRNDK